jgi:hypothetical protein
MPFTHNQKGNGYLNGNSTISIRQIRKKGRVTSSRRGLYKYYFPIGFDPFEGLENALALGIGIFSILLLALSITAYRKTGLKLTIYAIIIFPLFAIQQFLDFVDDIFVTLDVPVTDVIISSLTLAILLLFFLAIVRTRIT